MRVLFVSSHRIRCGIASFTDTLETLLEGRVEYDVFALDQFLLRNVSPNVKRVGDNTIRDLCVNIIPKFDVINLQWEPGLLGITQKQIIRRTKAIFSACVAHKKHLVVTAHTVVGLTEESAARTPLRRYFKNPTLLYKTIQRRFDSYVKQTHRLLRWVDREGSLTLIAHTARDRRFFEYVVGLKRVLDHPLSYMRKDWPETLAAENRIKRAEFEAIAGPNKIYLVLYGFLSEYKGVDTAIEAMRHLPTEYVLLIYGSVHPGNIKKFEKINPYVQRLLNAMGGDRTLQQRLAGMVQKSGGVKESNPAGAEVSRALDIGRPLVDRVFFVESPDDFDLARVVSAADVCILPHMEIGQSASGVASQAIDLGKRTLLSRTKTFMELGDYFPGRIDLFEIGNSLQLAQSVQRLLSKPELGSAGLPYTNRTMSDFYMEAFQWK